MRPSVERRATERFRLKLPITIRWTNRSGITEAQAESQDVSSRGIYFFLVKQIEAGSPIDIVMALPDEMTLGGPKRIHFQGRVQRTEIKKLNLLGVAAQIERYDFLSKKRGSDAF
jgi:hypothetical protein